MEEISPQQREYRPPRASANSCWIESLPPQLALKNEALTSPIAACDPGGRGTVFCSRSFSIARSGRTVRPRFSRCFHQCSRFRLSRTVSATIQYMSGPDPLSCWIFGTYPADQFPGNWLIKPKRGKRSREYNRGKSNTNSLPLY